MKNHLIVRIIWEENDMENLVDNVKSLPGYPIADISRHLSWLRYLLYTHDQLVYICMASRLRKQKISTVRHLSLSSAIHKDVIRQTEQHTFNSS